MARACSDRYGARSVISAIRHSFFVLSALAAFGAAPASAQGSTGSAPSAEAAGKPAAPKIGIVDFVRVVEAYPRAIEERKKVDELRKQQLTILDGEVKKAREMQIKLNDLQRGTLRYDSAQHELRLKQQDIDGMQTVFDREWRRRIDEFYTAIYSDLERAVALVAKDRGVMLVLRAHPELEDGSVESKARVFEARMVWYAAEELDLTPAVIQLLQVPLPPDPKAAPAPSDKPTGGDKPADGTKKDASGS